jgi:hypothetical protein
VGIIAVPSDDVRCKVQRGRSSLNSEADWMNTAHLQREPHACGVDMERRVRAVQFGADTTCEKEVRICGQTARGVFASALKVGETLRSGVCGSSP